MTLVPGTGLSTTEQYVHWDTSRAGQTIDNFHLEQVKSIQILASGNKTSNVIVVDTEMLPPSRSISSCTHAQGWWPTQNSLPTNSQMKPCTAISILATGTNLSCYCQLWKQPTDIN